MRQFHAGPERNLPQMRHLRGDDWLFLKIMVTKLICVAFFIFLLASPSIGGPEEPQPQSQEASDDKPEPEVFKDSPEKPPEPEIAQINENGPQDEVKADGKGDSPYAGILSNKYWENPITLFTLVLAVTSILLFLLAWRQASLTKEAFTKTQRALVFVEDIEFTQNGNNTDFAISFFWKNNGITPTKGLFTYVSAAIFPDELPEDFGFPNVKGGKSTQLYLGAKSNNRSVLGPCALDEITPVWEGKTHMYCWGWAEYNDVFKNTKRHRFEFCYKVTASKSPSSPKTMSFSHILHDKHNGEDEECLKPVETTWPPS